MYNDLTLKVDETTYTKLNRASREYDGLITDIYYYIINGNKPNTVQFENLMSMALEAYYAYGELKDRVSNEIVIPAVKSAYDIPDDKIISNVWNIEFNNSNTCNVTSIKLEDYEEKLVYEGDCEDRWINDVANLSAKITICNEVFAKINTNIVTNEEAKAAITMFRDYRIDLNIKDSNNREEFVNSVIAVLLQGYDASTCVWRISATAKKLYIVDTKQNV